MYKYQSIHVMIIIIPSPWDGIMLISRRWNGCMDAQIQCVRLLPYPINRLFLNVWVRGLQPPLARNHTRYLLIQPGWTRSDQPHIRPWTSGMFCQPSIYYLSILDITWYWVWLDPNIHVEINVTIPITFDFVCDNW